MTGYHEGPAWPFRHCDSHSRTVSSARSTISAINIQADAAGSVHNRPRPQSSQACRMSERLLHLTRTPRSLSIMSTCTRQSSCEILRRRQPGAPQQPLQNTILFNSSHSRSRRAEGQRQSSAARARPAPGSDQGRRGDRSIRPATGRRRSSAHGAGPGPAWSGPRRTGWRIGTEVRAGCRGPPPPANRPGQHGRHQWRRRRPRRSSPPPP